MSLDLQCGRGVRSPSRLALHHVVEPKAGSLAVGLSRDFPGMRDPGLGEFPIQSLVQGEFCRQGFLGTVEPFSQRGNGRLQLELHRRHRQMALAVCRQRRERICGPCERGITTFNLHGAHVCPDRVFPCRGEVVHTGLCGPFVGDATRGQRQPTWPLSGQFPSVRGHGPCQRGRCRLWCFPTRLEACQAGVLQHPSRDLLPVDMGLPVACPQGPSQGAAELDSRQLHHVAGHLPTFDVVLDGQRRRAQHKLLRQGWRVPPAGVPAQAVHGALVRAQLQLQGHPVVPSDRVVGGGDVEVIPPNRVHAQVE